MFAATWADAIPVLAGAGLTLLGGVVTTILTNRHARLMDMARRDYESSTESERRGYEYRIHQAELCAKLLTHTDRIVQQTMNYIEMAQPLPSATLEDHESLYAPAHQLNVTADWSIALRVGDVMNALKRLQSVYLGANEYGTSSELDKALADFEDALEMFTLVARHVLEFESEDGRASRRRRRRRTRAGTGAPGNGSRRGDTASGPSNGDSASSDRDAADGAPGDGNGTTLATLGQRREDRNEWGLPVGHGDPLTSA